MKLQNTATLVDIGLIDISEELRQRQAGRAADRRIDTNGLESSINIHGLLNPILIEATEGGRWLLKAGERRLTACRNLGHQKILCRKASSLSPVESQIVELVENVHRLDLDWQDLARGIGRIHRLYMDLDPDWTMAETGANCGLSAGMVSMHMSVEAQMGNPRIAAAGGLREAYNIIKRLDQREAGAALEELLATPDAPSPALPKEDATPEEKEQIKVFQDLGTPIPQHLLAPQRPVPLRVIAPAESILNLSFLDWAPTYSGPKFNLIHCDFPYGVELFSGPQGRGAEPSAGYKDSVDTYQTLLAGLCTNLDKVMSVSSHLMFWLSADYRIIYDTIRYFGEHAPSLKFQKFPLIWSKSDNAGIASDPRHGPRHIYEACLLASRGNRNIARVKGDSYSAPTDKKLHPSTKPEPMLRHFMEMLVDETTTMLDPTCGSGASLRAAESLGATRVLGLEIDPQFVEPARTALRNSRAMRAAQRESIL